MLPFLARRWFLILLALALLAGILGHARLEPWVGTRSVRNVIVAVVMFLMAFPLDASAILQAVRRPAAPLLATLVTFGLLPALAWLISPLLSPELAGGLLVAAATPCTVASATVWTRRAGGNDAVATMVTVLTNAICFVVTPGLLLLMTGRRAANLDAREMIAELGVLVVLPMVCGQLARRIPGWGAWATARRHALGILAQLGVLSMVLLGAIQTGKRLFASEAAELRPDHLAMMGIAVLVVHLAMLAVGMLLARVLGFSRGDQIAIGISGSQKTLMIGLKIAMEMQFSILPMITYHVGQLFVDTLVADRLRKSKPDPDP